MYLIEQGLDSPKAKLRIAIMAILANNSERLGIYPFDLLTKKCHIKILKILSVKNPMEYSEEYLKYCLKALSSCMNESNSILIEDLKKEEKSISWKKIIAILKHFMGKNKEEDVKMSCCKIFMLLVKY